jgi:predicted acyltransferase
MPSPTQSEAAPAQPSVRRRADALDALRGFAILTMVLSGVIPWHVLPDWMYHAQLPPPLNKFDPSVPGITWVDLVFPFFLFAMGASMPLALGRRMARGEPWWKLAWYVGHRGILLGLFAIYHQHIQPWTLRKDPTTSTWLVSLAGFLLLFPALSRLPGTWPTWRRAAIRTVGWVGAIALMASLPRLGQDITFSVTRNNIILVVLTNMAVFGSAAWLLTQRNQGARLLLLVPLLGLRLAHAEPGWVHAVWEWSPIPWMYKLYYLQYLFIVIPGTIAGDILRDWLDGRSAAPVDRRGTALDHLRHVAIVCLCVGMVVLMLAGLHSRWLPGTILVGLAGCGLGSLLFRRAETATGVLLRRLYAWGACWLVLGLIFEPYEGGIKKDHATMSYYFVTSGLACFTLIAFTVIIDVWQGRRWMRLLIDNGQNPMIAYAGSGAFMAPLLNLTGLEGLLVRGLHTPWLGFLRGCIKTFLLALFVSLCTRLRVFWRT